MIGKINSLYICTEDGLRLPGFLYEPEQKSDTCVVITHGMSGNLLENYFADILGKALTGQKITCLYGHNRGHSHINDMITNQPAEDGGWKTIRMGAAYEDFEGCLYDIDAWLNEARNLGYKKIILLGHSLGCNKTIHYFAQKKPQGVVGIILASPPDMVGIAKDPKGQPNYQEMVEEAQQLVEKNEGKKFLSSLLWDWYNLSAETFLNLFEDGCPADNLPVLRNPDKFDELSKVDVPVLGIMGENDDITIRTLEEDLALIASKATSCPKFTQKFIPKANHTYQRQENVFADVVLEWIKSSFI